MKRFSISQVQDDDRGDRRCHRDLVFCFEFIAEEQHADDGRQQDDADGDRRVDDAVGQVIIWS